HDFVEALWGDSQAAGDVCQEEADVGGFLGAAEAKPDQGVETVHGYMPRAWTPPSTHTMLPVVAGSQSDRRAHTERATGVALAVSQPRGARSLQESRSRLKPGMDLAAMVPRGPAATRLTRMPWGPSSRAR